MGVLTSDTHDVVSADEDGEVVFRRRTLYYDDGILVGDSYETKVFQDGDDVSAEPQLVQDVSAAVWP